MNHKQLYEFRDMDGAGNPEVVMSRYDEGNYNSDAPNARVVIYSSNDNWKYDAVGGTNDADGDGKHDDEDRSYYINAANFVTQMVTLSPFHEGKRLFDRILIAFDASNVKDVNIMHFNKGNRDLTRPDFTVTAANPDQYWSYRSIIATSRKDADGDGDIDLDDDLIYRRLATSFASMRNLKP
ncbi:hypothetical protein [Pseudomonas sp. WMBT8]|uniref:hypothetical protein n=1 Tax=Pseudomonas sp. WMBT8 TaxID=3414496 RepID=UPI003D805E84